MMVTMEIFCFFGGSAEAWFVEGETQFQIRGFSVVIDLNLPIFGCFEIIGIGPITLSTWPINSRVVSLCFRFKICQWIIWYIFAVVVNFEFFIFIFAIVCAFFCSSIVFTYLFIIKMMMMMMMSKSLTLLGIQHNILYAYLAS